MPIEPRVMLNPPSWRNIQDKPLESKINALRNIAPEMVAALTVIVDDALKRCMWEVFDGQRSNARPADGKLTPYLTP